MAIEAVGKNQTIKQEQKQSATTIKTKKKQLIEGDCSVRNCSWTKKDAP